MTDKAFSKKIQQGLNETYRQIVLQKRRTGEMLIFSENGEVKYVDPNSVEV